MTWGLRKGEWLGDTQNQPAGSNALWGRKWKILIAKADDSEGWNVSTLRCVFEVKKEKETQNYATISIYNLTRDTERAIIHEGDRLIIEAGYGTAETVVTVDEENINGGVTTVTQYGKIFDGKIIYPTRHRENNTDYVLTLLCVDGDNPLNKDFVAQTLRRGMNQRQIAQSVCDMAETKIPTAHISENLSPQCLPRGKVLFGKPKDYLRNIARGNNATFWVDNDTLSISKYIDTDEMEALVVSPKTGLVGMPTQTQYGATWTLLLNPSVKMFSKCQLQSTDIVEYKGAPGGQWAPLDEEMIYQVMRLVHKGDTWGNEWYTECEGISRVGKTALPAMMANININPRG